MILIAAASGAGAVSGAGGAAAMAAVALRRVPPPIAVDPVLHAYAAATRAPTPDDARHASLALPLPPALDRAAPRRIATFLAGRYCALAALRAAGAAMPARALGIRADGAPAWPAGFVGSITHTDDLAVAVVARSDARAGIGIDCERRLAPAEAAELAPVVLPELSRVAVRDAGRPVDRATLVVLGFSAKESLYKCLAPIAGVFFEFHDAALVDVDLERRRLRLRLLRELAPGLPQGMTLDGRFVVDDSVVFTIVELAPV